MARTVPEHFLVAFSFAGEQRDLVRSVAQKVEQILGNSTVFLDEWYEYYIAGHDADSRLQDIYSRRSALVVVCVSGDYGRKSWTQGEYEAVRSRLLEARGDKNKSRILAVLPLRVGEGNVDGIHFNTVVPDIRDRTIEASAQLIIDRLQAVAPDKALPGKASPTAQPTEKAELRVERIVSFHEQKSLIRKSLALYEERIPPEERFSQEHMVDLVRRHLEGEFGSSWRMHFIAATYGEQCVGMLLCYEDVRADFVFISYLAARCVRSLRLDSLKISSQLAECLISVRRELGLSSRPRFLFEIDDPALTEVPRERRHRLARLRLFDGLAPFEATHLRALDIPYLQPSLGFPKTCGEKQMLLCYARKGLHSSLEKREAVEILEWVYTELYGDDVFEDSEVRKVYRQHTRDLLASLIRKVPAKVPLLCYREIEKRP